MFRPRIQATLCLAALSLASACTGESPLDDGGQTTTTANDAASETTGEPSTTDSDDSSTDTDTDTPEAELVIVVVVDQPFGDPATPGVGASVAVDTSNGRIEVTADAEGRAVIEGFTWSDGPVDVTVGTLETSLRSHVGVVEADTEAGEFEVHVAVGGVSDNLIEIYGSVTKSAPVHDLSFSATNAVSYAGPGSDWSMYVPANQPFTLVALELDYLPVPQGVTDNPIFSWVALTHAGVSEPTELVIDLQMPTPSTQISGSFVMPGRPDSPLRTNPFGFVYTVSGVSAGPLVGRSTHTQVSPDGELCSFDLEYIEPEGIVDPITCYRVLLPPAYEFSSTACEPGYPSAVLVDIDIIDTPELPFVANRGLHDPIEFQIFDADVTPSLAVYYSDLLVWRITGPVDATSITIPQPPTGFGAQGVTLDATLELHRVAPGGVYFERRSTSQRFELDG